VTYEDTPTPSCQSFSINNGSFVVVKRFGDEAMSDSSTIWLYSGLGFLGTLNRISEPNNLNIDINVGSYVFTGSSNSWLPYDSANYTGTKTCISPHSRVISNGGWGHTYNKQTNISVRSLQQVDRCPTSSTGSSTSMSYILAIFLSMVLAQLTMGL